METKRKAFILFDTDIGGDCDDAGALALLHRLCDRGEAQLLAVTACYASPYAAGCIDAINTYNKRQVPVGVLYEKGVIQPGVYSEQLAREFPNRFPAEQYGTEKQPPDTVAVLRRALAEAEDGSITFVVTGALSSMAALLRSEADGISPLTGRELIETKIARAVVMGGRFIGTWPMQVTPDEKPPLAEWNIKADIPAAQIVCECWPGELVFSSYEIGLWCVSLTNFASRGAADDPARRAYEIHSGDRGRQSWDLTAILEAVRPGEYYCTHPWGRLTVDDRGVTDWHREDGARQTYLIPRADYGEVRSLIDALVMGDADGGNITAES